MALVTNNLSVLVNVQDGTSGVNLINRSSGVVSYAGVAGELEKKTLANDTNIHAFDLPCAVVLQGYIKNTHATANLLITATVQGGASAVSIRIGPGGFWAFANPATGTTIGFTAISYTSDVALATAEVFFGG